MATPADTRSRLRGADRLVAALDEAIRDGTVEEITARVKQSLSGLIREGALALPEEARRPQGDGYARRLLHRSDELGYTVLAMIWGPEQGTPLHDHAGIWCVDGVLEGVVEVVQYELLAEEGDRCRFARRERVEAGVGTAGSLIPPFEYHTITNPRAETSITIHVYGGELDRCSVFVPEGEGWHRRETRDLAVDG